MSRTPEKALRANLRLLAVVVRKLSRSVILHIKYSLGLPLPISSRIANCEQNFWLVKVHTLQNIPRPPCRQIPPLTLLLINLNGLRRACLPNYILVWDCSSFYTHQLFQVGFSTKIYRTMRTRYDSQHHQPNQIVLAGYKVNFARQKCLHPPKKKMKLVLWL